MKMTLRRPVCGCLACQKRFPCNSQSMVQSRWLHTRERVMHVSVGKKNPMINLRQQGWDLIIEIISSVFKKSLRSLNANLSNFHLPDIYVPTFIL